MDNQAKVILVVEDNSSIRELAEMVLADAGYCVIAADNGQSALDLLSENAFPHLIFLDLKMPVMNGPEFAREFRRKYQQNVPIVIISGLDDLRYRSEELQAQAYLEKPFDIEDLVEVANKILCVPSHSIHQQ